jgi:hypothetical protein
MTWQIVHSFIYGQVLNSRFRSTDDASGKHEIVFINSLAILQPSSTTSNSNIEVLERFQTKVLLTIVDATWYVPNTVILKVFQTPTIQDKNSSLQLSKQCSPQRTPQRPSSDLHGATRQQTIAKTPAKQCAYQILSLIIVFRIQFISLIPTSCNMPSTYQLQKSSTEPSSAWYCINYTVCWMYWYRLQIKLDYKKINSVLIIVNYYSWSWFVS